MARTPQIRVSFSNDTGYLIRLQKAVEKDPNIPPKRKREILDHLVSLAQLFMSEDAIRIAKGGE